MSSFNRAFDGQPIYGTHQGLNQAVCQHCGVALASLATHADGCPYPRLLADAMRATSYDELAARQFAGVGNALAPVDPERDA